MAFSIKQNDTSPSLQATLKDASLNPINIVGATVMFHMKSVDGTIKVDQQMAVIDDVGGVVQYVWQTGDTAIAGWYRAEFEVTYSDGKIETFPNDGAIWIHVNGELS